MSSVEATYDNSNFDLGDRLLAYLTIKEAVARSRAADALLHAARQRSRPSVVLGVSVSQVRNGYWLAEYFGVFASGETPDAACHNFDKVWQGVN